MVFLSNSNRLTSRRSRSGIGLLSTHHKIGRALILICQFTDAGVGLVCFDRDLQGWIGVKSPWHYYVLFTAPEHVWSESFRGRVQSCSLFGFSSQLLESLAIFLEVTESAVKRCAYPKQYPQWRRGDQVRPSHGTK